MGGWGVGDKGGAGGGGGGGAREEPGVEQASTMK